jgi:hypothetical protein
MQKCLPQVEQKRQAGNSVHPYEPQLIITNETEKKGMAVFLTRFLFVLVSTHTKKKKQEDLLLLSCKRNPHASFVYTL